MEAQLVVTRRCNLSCGYCTEYDAHSPEVPYEVLQGRIDAIHRLRAANIALLGGEPLLHSRLTEVIRHAARRAQVSMTTNGFLLDDSTIDALGDAGLANLQISIDALRPDPDRYVQKTLKSVRPKLERLSERARFDVHVTVVLCEATLGGFAELLSALEAFPFRVSVNLVHDGQGRVLVTGPEFERLWREHFASGRPFSFIEEEYGRRLLAGERPSWHCRAGARFLYVDEDGRVELCSAQRGRIGKPVLEYTVADLAAHHRTEKGCEAGCSLFCAYRDSQLDNDPLALGRALVKGLLPRGVRRLLRPPGANGDSSEEDTPRRRLPLVAR